MTQMKYNHIDRFVLCRCSKQHMIQLGWGYLIYANISALIGFIILSVTSIYVLRADPFVLLFIGYTLLAIFSAIWGYKYCFKQMIEKGHTNACSEYIAKRATWYQSLYSKFIIDVDPKIVDPEGDYVTAAIGIWSTALAVNTVFFVQYAEGDAGSWVYPILFLFTITLSVIQLFRIKNMSRGVLAVHISNIATSNLFLFLYLLNVLVAITS